MLSVAKAQWGPVQVQIRVRGSSYTLQARSIDMVSRTTMTSGGYLQSRQLTLGEACI